MINICICIFCTCLLGIIFKFIKRRQLNISKVVLINYLYCSLVGVFIERSNLLHQEPTIYFFSIFLGGLFIIGLNAFGMSIHREGLSLTTAIQKLSMVATICFGLGLGESVNWMQSFGIILCFTALYFIFVKSELKSKSSHSKSLLVTFVISSLIEMIFLYISKNVGIGHSFALTSLIFIFAFIFGLIHYFKFFIFGLNRNEFLAGISIGVPNFFSILYLNKILESGMPGSIFFPLLNISVIVSGVIIGLFVFSEKLNSWQWLGLSLAFTSILLMSI